MAADMHGQPDDGLVPPTRRIRIAHLQLLPLLSGVQKVTLDELTRIDRGRFEPFVICKEPGPFTEALGKAGIPCHFVPDLVRNISPAHDLRALRHLARLFREQRFDIVHTHSSKTGILGRLAGRMAGVPVVMHTVHGYAFPAARSAFETRFYLAIEWIGMRVTDALVLLKQDDLNLAFQRLQAPPRKLHLIPNGVDVHRYAPLGEEARTRLRQEALGLGEHEVAIVMVGRLWRQKNPECLVRAAIRLLKDGHNTARFYLIGDGELRESLEKLVREHGLEHAICFLGWRDDVDKLLGAMDVFVLPSRWEGMPLAILEAMASGLPVVVSDIPGNRDLVSGGEDGFTFADDDDADLADKLAPLVADGYLRHRLGTAGREKVIQSYNLEDRMKRMVQLYEDLFTAKARINKARL